MAQTVHNLEAEITKSAPVHLITSTERVVLDGVTVEGAGVDSGVVDTSALDGPGLPPSPAVAPVDCYARDGGVVRLVSRILGFVRCLSLVTVFARNVRCKMERYCIKSFVENLLKYTNVEVARWKFIIAARKRLGIAPSSLKGVLFGV